MVLFNEDVIDVASSIGVIIFCKIENLNFRQADSYVKLNFRQGLFSTKNPFEAI